VNSILFICLIFITILALDAFGQTGDAEAGKSKSAVCAVCNGADGNSSNPVWPNLAGQHDQYLIKSMKDYRDGKRDDPQMNETFQSLSDQDIADLAAYYSSQKQN